MDRYHRRSDAARATLRRSLRCRKSDRLGFGHAGRFLHAGSVSSTQPKCLRRPSRLPTYLPTGVQQSQRDLRPCCAMGDLLCSRNPGFNIQTPGIFGGCAGFSSLPVGSASDDLRYRTLQRGFASVSLAYVVLCPIGALHWGITGAAAAALVVQVILFVLFEIQVRRFVVPRHAEALFLPSLLGLAAAALARLLHLSVFPALTLLALAYGVLGVHHLRVVNWRPFREDESQTT